MNSLIGQAISWVVNVLVYALLLYGADRIIWPTRVEGRKHRTENR